MNAIIYALFTALLLSACSVDSTGPTTTNNSDSSGGPDGCDDADVKVIASAELAKWLDQNLINQASGFDVRAPLVVTMSSAIDITDNTDIQIQGIKACMGNGTIGYQDAAGNWYVSGSFPHVEFSLADGPNGPQVTLEADPDDRTLPDIYALMNAEEQHEKAAPADPVAAAATPPPEPPPAQGYASYICHVNHGCKQIGPTTIYPTKANCQFAAMSDPNFVPGNSTVWHECRTVQAQFASSSQEELPQPVQSQAIPPPPESALTVHPATDLLPLPSVPSKSQPQLTPQSSPSPSPAPADAADDDLAPVKTINPDAAAQIQSYCSKIPAGGPNRTATLKSCEQREMDAWQRVVLKREFPEDNSALDRRCSEPPFPADSFVAYETCMKYERNIQ